MAEPSLLVYVRVTSIEAQFLAFVGGRGGEIPWDWEKCRPDVTALVRGLIDDKKLLVERKDARRIRLTDQGRQALSQIDDARRRAPTIVST